MKFIYNGQLIDVSKSKLIKRSVGVSCWAAETGDYSQSGNEWYISDTGIIFRLWVKDGCPPRFYSCDDSDINYLASNNAINIEDIFDTRQANKLEMSLEDYKKHQRKLQFEKLKLEFESSK